MATAKIECPKCHSRFTLNAPSLEAMASKPFLCPKCGFSSSFGQLLGIRARAVSAPHTHIAGGVPSADGKTHVASRGNLVSLVVETTGRIFSLAQGVYTLGRDSSDSRASLRIAPDPYMSRLQAGLEVSPGTAGTKCRVVGLNATNPVFVNNVRLEPNTGVSLKNGDRLLLGMTKVIVRM